VDKLWITIWPVDNFKNADLSTAYPQWQKSHKLKLSTGYPQGYAQWQKYNSETYPQVIHIEFCGARTTLRKTRLTNGFLAGGSRPKFCDYSSVSPPQYI